jgi:hypothetical protein
VQASELPVYMTFVINNCLALFSELARVVIWIKSKLLVATFELRSQLNIIVSTVEVINVYVLVQLYSKGIHSVSVVIAATWRSSKPKSLKNFPNSLKTFPRLQ